MFTKVFTRVRAAGRLPIGIASTFPFPMRAHNKTSTAFCRSRFEISVRRGSASSQFCRVRVLRDHCCCTRVYYIVCCFSFT